MDLLGAARPCDEEEDLQNLTTAWHGEDLRHPAANPLEMLGRLDDPDEGEAAGSHRAICVAGNNLTHLGNLVGDANASSPEHDRAVGTEIFAPCRMLLTKPIRGVLGKARRGYLPYGPSTHAVVEKVPVADKLALL